MNLPILLIALYGLITSDNLIKKIMCLTVVESIVILGFLGAGFKTQGAAPILVDGLQATVDPVPQALMLTAIVIGVCFNSLAVGSILRLFEKHGTVRVSRLPRL